MATDDTRCDVLIVCALEKEARAVLDVISTQCGITFTTGYIRANRREYRKTTIVNDRNEQLDVCVSWAPKKGPEEMALHLPALMSECHPRFVGMTGICAGDRFKTALGNIIVGEMAFLFDTGKYIEDEFGRQVHQHNATPWHPNQTTLQYARLFDDWIELVRTLPRPPSRRQQRDWLIDQLLENHEISVRTIPTTELLSHAPDYRDIVTEMKKGPTPILTPELRLTDFGLQTDRFLQLGHTDKPECERQVAPIASGNAVHADHPFADAQTPVRDTIGLEMEGATFYRVIHDYPGVHSLLVKSVCDYADPEKDDSYHGYAAEASALYMLSFIQKYVNDDLMPRARTLHNEEAITQAPPLPKVPDNPPFFTGRSELLKDVRAKLQTPETPKPVAITGLGGEGKTCFATRFCHEYADEYTKIFWVQAQTETTLREDYAKIAAHLQLPEAKETDQELAVNAVKRWLEANSNWLLVLDNADDLPIACSFLPGRYNGHVLITTQPHNTGVYARDIPLRALFPDEAALLLLRRAKHISGAATLDSADPEYLDAARQIVTATDGLPLALDQAGAYIEARRITPARYLSEFQTRAADLLKKRGETSDPIHKSVAVTLSLAFDRVKEANADAADLLRCAAFLAPTNIPESIFTKGLSEFGPLWEHAADPNLWDEIVFEACRYSLLTHNTDSNTLNIHRLVQIVLIDTMTLEESKVQAHQILTSVAHTFPSIKYEYWVECDQFLPHAQECAKSIRKHNFLSANAGSMLFQLASYLGLRAKYEQALPEYLLANAILINTSGLEHPNTLSLQLNMANLFADLARYDEAEKLYLKVGESIKKIQGEEHPDTLSCMNNLAVLYVKQGRYNEAEKIYLHVTTKREKVLGKEHPDTYCSIDNLANLYSEQGRYDEAEPLYLKVTKNCEQILGKEHPNTLGFIGNLANFYLDRGRYDDAEPLYLKVKEICERLLGEEHPNTLGFIGNLANLYLNQGRYAESEKLYLRIIDTRNQLLAKEHPDMLISIGNLANLYLKQGRYIEAEKLYLRVQADLNRTIGNEHPDSIRAIHNLAVLYVHQGRYVEAEPLCLQVKASRERVLGKEHPHTLLSIGNLATLYLKLGRYEEAEKLYLQLKESKRRVLGEEHPETLSSISDLGALYMDQGRYVEAEPLCLQVKLTRERILGKVHPETISSIANLANLYSCQGRYDAAESLYLQVKEIRERILGTEHPQFLDSIANLATLYSKQSRYDEAEPLYLQVRRSREQVLGKEHPETLKIVSNLANLYRILGRYNQSEALYIWLIPTLGRKLGENHPSTKNALRSYLLILRTLGRNMEANIIERRLGI